MSAPPAKRAGNLLTRLLFAPEAVCPHAHEPCFFAPDIFFFEVLVRHSHVQNVPILEATVQVRSESNQNCANSPPESGGPTPSGTTAPAPLELCRPAAPTTQRHRSPGRCPEDSCWLGIENGAAAQRHLAGLHRAVAAVTAVAALAAFIAAPALCRLWRRSRRHCVRVVPRNTSRVASLSHPSQNTQPARR